MTNEPAATHRSPPDASLNNVNGGNAFLTDPENETLSTAEDDYVPNGGQTNGHASPNGEKATMTRPTHLTSPVTNGHGHDGNHIAEGDHDAGDRPSKRRRTTLEETSPGTLKNKPESPPWRRADADGPTSYHENGRRKSGRINAVPVEFQPPSTKRRTRRSINGTGASQGGSSKMVSPTTERSMRPSRGGQRPASAGNKSSQPKSLPASTPKSATKKPTSSTKTTPRQGPRKLSSPQLPARFSSRTRRASRLTDDKDNSLPTDPGDHSAYPSREGMGRSPRIKLRVSRSSVIPLVHPHQVSKRQKIGTSFEDFWARAGNIPVEEGGLQASEDGPAYTDEVATREAHLISKIEMEAEDGGLLSQQRCSIFVPEAEEEPPRQWARQDHLVRAMSNFRRLMLAEQQRHRSTAKKVAEACREEWLRRQPKSAEDLAAEAREHWASRYRLVVRAMIGTWENARLHVNRKRLEEWEAEEQRRVKAALNEAVSLSEQKLQARQSGLDVDVASDDDFSGLTDDMSNATDDDGSLDSATDMTEEHDDDVRESSDNMSSDSEEGDDPPDLVDEDLTLEQLQQKYANMPTSTPNTIETGESAIVAGPTDAGNPEPPTDVAAYSSDESVDMDDDMGSTDVDSEDFSEASGEDEESEDDSQDGANGLLGLLFGKSELKQIKDETENNGLDDEGGVSVIATTESPSALRETPDLTGITESVPSKSDSPDKGLLTAQNKQQVESEGQVNADSADPDLSSNFNADARTARAASQATSAAAFPDAMDVDEEFSHSPVQEESSNANSGAAITNSTPPGSAQAESYPNQLLGDPVANSSLSAVKEETSKPEAPSPSPATDIEKSSESSSSHKTEIPFLLRGTLREYQHDGLDWLAGLYANNTNGILADEMGLGKTIQTIALLAHLACHHEVWGPHLVIVPTSVMLNWEMEFKKWCPGFKILAYYGTQEERKRKRQGWNNDDVWNVCITSYQLVLQDQQVFKRRRWHYMILDEAHNIKNFKSQRWQTLLGFNTHSRLLLTGTPLQNNLTELWSLLFFLMPAENGVGGFADLQEFHEWFHKPESQILESGREQMDDEAKAIISKLHKVLRPYLLRRLKADVEKQMPAKYEHVEFCRLSKRQRELYDGFLSRAETKDTLASGNYMSIINCLMQLRKVCNHPDLFVDRPIMTSFRMQKSIASSYDHVDRVVRRTLLAENPMDTVSLQFLNMVPTKYENLSSVASDRVVQLSSNRTLLELREAQKARAQTSYTNLDPSTVDSNIVYLESAARWGRFEELQHCFYVNALRRQQKPTYGQSLLDRLTIGIEQRPFKSRPKIPRNIMSWFEDDSPLIHSMVPSLDQRADSLKTTIEKFSCVTPAVVTKDLDALMLGSRGVQAFTEEDLRLSAPIRWTPSMPKTSPLDPWHEARMRLSIQFPDKRLLQYDCGKLQVLDKLLRKLQVGGHRALIFTQMTKVLDILEQFLNIHGHKYLRLDGATKVEQRQILTDRFNHDPRILCFILSTRSGGLGINLTGADTVIFYDQDWNPAMDKQCQDRCHRIGQTRDVHIYRLVSEHTIEANILRKASQKQMLDDVVIQEGEFTTDSFNKVSVRDVLSEKVDFQSEGVAAADAALDRVLGRPDDGRAQRTVGRVLEQAEDTEDVTAARAAEKEIQADDADFTEKPSNAASVASTTRQGTPAYKSALDEETLDEAHISRLDEIDEYNAWGCKIHTIDDYMLHFMGELLKGTKLDLPKDKKKAKKKGKDTRKR